MPPASSEPRVCLGRISGAKGLKGEVRIRTYTGRPRDIAAYGPVADEADKRAFAVTVVTETDGGVIARIAGINDRTAAEKLRGIDLYVPRRALPALPAGEYYQSDLVGLAARAADGAALGRILAIHDYGAGTILEVGDGGRASELWPARTVGAVDLGRGEIVLHRPEEIMAAEQAAQGRNLAGQAKAPEKRRGKKGAKGQR